MQSSELLFGVVDSLSEPVLLFEKSEGGAWLNSYKNQLMQKLFDANLDTKDGLLQQLLKHYDEEAGSSNYTLYDVEIFDTIYNIHFSKNNKHLLVLFMEIKPEEFFKNISFHDLSGVCNAIVVVLDSTGHIIDTNECFADFVGLEKENIIGKGFFETFIPGNIETLNRYFAGILEKDIYHQQFVTPMKGLEDKSYIINWQVSKIVKHEQTYIIAVGGDITRFIEENSALKKQLTSIKVGFEYFPLAIGYMDAKGMFTKMNPRFMKMFNIALSDEKIAFDKIALFRKHIGFEKMNEHIKLIKEMSYKIDFLSDGKPMKLKVDIRLLSGKKESSKFYIVVAQKIT